MCLGQIGVVKRVWEEAGLPMASVDFGDREEPVCLAYVPETGPGTDVLVHMGFALEALEFHDAADARTLRRGGELDLGEAPRPPL
jgi:hydrogenase expression/formation protein HypC